MESLELEMEAVPDTEPDRLETALVKAVPLLHHNHYLLTDAKRRLIGTPET